MSAAIDWVLMAFFGVAVAVVVWLLYRIITGTHPQQDEKPEP
jgi:uncharacterized membrane protein